MQNKYYMIVLPLLFLLSTCGYNTPQTSGTGAISFGVEWIGGPESAPAAASIYRAPLDCTAAGVATVEAALYATNPQNTLNLIASGGPWDCSAHTGDITISGPQNGATIGIMGKNAGGGVVYYGEQGNIQATTGPGQVTDIGVIVATYVIPEGVTALAGSGKNLISWNTVTSAASYNLYWSTTPGVTPANGTKIASVTSPYTHDGIANGTTYYYIVTASRINVESAGSSQVSALPIAGATMPVTAAATSITDTGATLNGSFDNPPDYSTTASFEYGTTTSYGTTTTQGTYGATGPVNSIPFPLTGLSQNTTYHYRLKTLNSGGTFNGADATFSTLRTVSTIGTVDVATNRGPRGIAVDATSVYWTDTQFISASVSSGSIKSVLKSGGTVTTIAAGATLSTPFSIAEHADSVYWTDTVAGTINTVLKTGGTPTALASNLSSPQFIAVDANNVYWTESGANTVSKVSIGGGAVTVLASGPTNPMGIAVDATNVYWTERTGGFVKKIGINGDPATLLILAQGLTNPYGIAVDAANDYWTENTTGWTGTNGNPFVFDSIPRFTSSTFGNIKKVGINGGVVTTLATTQKNPHGIAVDSSSVYWTSNQGSCGVDSLSKVGINGGTVTAIATAECSPLSLAVDAASVYWAAYQRGVLQADK